MLGTSTLKRLSHTPWLLCTCADVHARCTPYGANTSPERRHPANLPSPSIPFQLPCPSLFSFSQLLVQDRAAWRSNNVNAAAERAPKGGVLASRRAPAQAARGPVRPLPVPPLQPCSSLARWPVRKAPPFSSHGTLFSRFCDTADRTRKPASSIHNTTHSGEAPPAAPLSPPPPCCWRLLLGSWPSPLAVRFCSAARDPGPGCRTWLAASLPCYLLAIPCSSHMLRTPYSGLMT